VNDVDPDDLALACSIVSGHGTQTFELRTLFPTGENRVDIAGGAGRYLVYIEREDLAPDPLHSYSVNVRTFNGTVQQHGEFPLCTFYWNGGIVQIDATHPVVDRRVWGSVGYAHIQRNKNWAGNNNLPQLLVCMWGLTDVILENNYSDEIFLTHDWGVDATTGGGSSLATGGMRVFATKPSIMVYYLLGGVYSSFGFGSYIDPGPNTYGYYISALTETSFRIFNSGFAADPDRQFYWIAIGTPFANSANFILGKNNPNYGEEV